MNLVEWTENKARELLKKRTKSELKFDSFIKTKFNLEVESQVPVYVKTPKGKNPEKSYIMDFFIPSLNICIELDGKHHYEGDKLPKDMIRDRLLLEQHGITTIRFKNETLLLNNFFNIFHREIKHKTGVDIQKYIRTKKEEKKCTTVVNKQPKKKKSNKKTKFKDKEKQKLENWVNKKHHGKSKKEKEKMVDKIWYNRKNGNYSQNITTKKDFFI